MKESISKFITEGKALLWIKTNDFQEVERAMIESLNLLENKKFYIYEKGKTINFLNDSIESGMDDLFNTLDELYPQGIRKIPVFLLIKGGIDEILKKNNLDYFREIVDTKKEAPRYNFTVIIADNEDVPPQLEDMVDFIDKQITDNEGTIKKYILDLKYSYSEGDDEQSLKLKTIYEISENTNEKVKEKVYEYTENSSIKDYEESCYQNIFKIDKEILEDSALRLPSEKEILAKHINESYYNEEFIANQKEHYFNQFKDVFADLVEERNLQDKLPPFQIITENGIGLDEDKNISDELKNLILDVKGEEYWNNLNLRDIRNFEELADLGIVSILVTDIEKDEFKEYTNYNDYISPTVKEELSKEFKDKLSKGNIEQFENELKDKVLTKVSSDKSIKSEDKEFTKGFEKDFSENNRDREKEF